MKLQAKNGNIAVDLDAMVLMCNVLEAKNRGLRESIHECVEIMDEEPARDFLKQALEQK